MNVQKHTKLSWKNGVPVSSKFDDPYYSLDSGLDESRFVFYDGAKVQQHFDTKDQIVIGETGFGTGLNFLTTWQAWRRTARKSRFTFISCEAYPLSVSDLSKAHAAFPELAPYAEELREKWPPPASGFHLLKFEGGAITLILMFGDVVKMFSEVQASIDVWYLDGFAPAKNPTMWSDDLFSQMARLSRPQATLATFTAAGFVRRGLISHGFAMQKVAGYGRKRERLIGTYEAVPAADIPSPKVPLWATIKPSPHTQVAVIGAGIGGMMTAHALQNQGVKVIVYKDEAAGNTTQNLPVAVLAPKFTLSTTPEQRFYDAAFTFAAHHPAYTNERNSLSGMQVIAKTTEEIDRLNQISRLYQWPDTWLQHSENYLTVPKAMTVKPAAVIEEMAKKTQLETCRIYKVQRTNGVWQMLSVAGEVIAEADTLVIAAGIETHGLLERSGLLGQYGIQHPELRANAGQIEIVQAGSLADTPQTTLSYGGYLTAQVPQKDNNYVRGIGSTYQRLNRIPVKPPVISDKKRQENLENLYRNTGIKIQNKDVSSSWSGVRATVADHLPFAGPIPNWNDLIETCQPLALDAKNKISRNVHMQTGLYMLAGLGSKGFQYAPILGEYLAAMIVGNPLPLPSDLIARLHPGRGMVRAIIRSNQL